MNKLLLCVLCLLAVFAAVTPCLADTVNGVLAEERVINLPQDQSKWFVSVVGNATDRSGTCFTCCRRRSTPATFPRPASPPP